MSANDPKRTWGLTAGRSGPARRCPRCPRTAPNRRRRRSYSGPSPGSRPTSISAGSCASGTHGDGKADAGRSEGQSRSSSHIDEGVLPGRRHLRRYRHAVRSMVAAARNPSVESPTSRSSAEPRSTMPENGRFWRSEMRRKDRIRRRKIHPCQEIDQTSSERRFPSVSAHFGTGLAPAWSSPPRLKGGPRSPNSQVS